MPLNTDPVSKLQIIGKETVAKLRDLRSALASAHHEDVQVLDDYVHDTNSVRTGVLHCCYRIVAALMVAASYVTAWGLGVQSCIRTSSA